MLFSSALSLCSDCRADELFSEFQTQDTLVSCPSNSRRKPDMVCDDRHSCLHFGLRELFRELMGQDTSRLVFSITLTAEVAELDIVLSVPRRLFMRNSAWRACCLPRFLYSDTSFTWGV